MSESNTPPEDFTIAAPAEGRSEAAGELAEDAQPRLAPT